MKTFTKLNIRTAAAALLLLSLWPSHAWGDDGSTAETITPGKETWSVVQNQRVDNSNSDTELEYFASANISVLIGAKEVWEAKSKTVDSETAYVIQSQGNPGILTGATNSNNKADQDEACYHTVNNKPYYVLPSTGNYYKIQFHTAGVLTLKFLFKGNSKKLWVAKSNGGSLNLSKESNSTTYTYTAETASLVSIDSVTVKQGETTLTRKSENSDNSKNGYYELSSQSAYSAYTITLTAVSGQEVYIWAEQSEELGLNSFTYEVDKNNIIFATGTPYVHKQIELGKDLAAQQGGSTNITGVENIAFMYGGWLNHPNAIKAATWNDTNKKWGIDDNGTKNNKYTVGSTEKTDKWEAAITESTYTTLDGYTSYVEGCGNAPLTEMGTSYEKPATAKATTVPCRGTYYKFEPQKNGRLTVYVRMVNSEVATPTTNNPLYLVDEGGQPQTAVGEKKTGTTNATITMTSDGGYTVSQSSACRFTFELLAGKTYVLFQNNQSLGFYGFTFGADDTATTTLELDDTQNFSYTAQQNATVTLKRKLNQGTWNTLTLPFSMTEAQVRAAFGEGTVISEYEGVTGNRAKMLNHYYQVVTAGKPIIIKPSKVSEQGSYTITGVTINAESPIEQTADGWTLTGTYSTTSMTAGSYYIGKASDATSAALYYVQEAMNIGSLRAYFKPEPTNSGAKLNGIMMGDNSETTEIDGIETTPTAALVQGIYTLQGQRIGTSTKGLSAGLYIINGKKVLIK